MTPHLKKILSRWFLLVLLGLTAYLMGFSLAQWQLAHSHRALTDQAP